MTIFSRYYKEDEVLVKTTMSDIEKLIEDESNKEEIADLVYHRFYDRFLKMFFYKPEDSKYKKEYKSGFLMMASACLVIENLAAFFQGNNHTKGTGYENFDVVFDKCKDYSNQLGQFKGNNIYKSIRCGLLHQGETYNKFKIRRTGDLFDKKDNAINATKFINSLKKLLESYRDDLKTADWDSDIWKNCRNKIRHIIENS